MSAWLRYVHPELQASLDGRRTSLCRVLRIKPRNGPAFGIASLNRMVAYNDGNGVVEYCARYGFDPSAIEATANTSIDNAEVSALLGVPDSYDAWGITEEMIETGYLDGASFIQYLIDYENAGTGKHAELHSGKLGQIRLPRTGVCIVECRDRMQQLAQRSMCVRDSITCRNIFGQNKNGVGCFADAEALWVPFTVTNIVEADLEFASTDLTAADDTYFPGKVEWLTGDNVGRAQEVHSFLSVGGVGVVTLAHTTRSFIQLGDTGRIRPDCTKIRDGDRGCKFYGQIKNYDGELDTPEAESRMTQSPKGIVS